MTVRVQHEVTSPDGDVKRWTHSFASREAAERHVEETRAWARVWQPLQRVWIVGEEPKKKEKPNMAPKKIEVREDAGSSENLEDLDETPKGRNREIPGTERKVVRQVKLAAARYVEARDERIRLGIIEKEKKTILIDRMKEHGIREHVDDALRVVLTEAKEGVKVTSVDEDTEDDGDDE